MESLEPTGTRLPLRRALAGALALAVVVTHMLLPEVEERAGTPSRSEDSSDERERLEIVDASPHDLYPGGSLTIRYVGDQTEEPLRVVVAKTELALVAERPGELIARLPRELKPGPHKVRIYQGTASLDSGEKSARSKPYLVRVKALNLRKLFRHLLGGGALLVLGIFLLSRGVRGAVDLGLARAVSRFLRWRPVAYGFGVASGAVLQSTTSAASLLTALHTSHLFPRSSAALGLLGAQLGAGLTPLLVAGLIEPREGLLLVGIGAIWLVLARDRRSSAFGRVLLGAGFVLFGLQLFRPALDPLVSDPVLLSFADEFSARDFSGACARALLGALLTAALQGPAGLIVLILGFAQATGRFDLLAALSLLAGASFGSALAAALAASGGERARALARLNLLFGLVSSVLGVASLSLWARLAELVVGTAAADSSALFAQTRSLAVGFAASELARAALLALLLPWLARRLGHMSAPLQRTRRAERAHSGVLRTPPGNALLRALSLQLRGLEFMRVLVKSGARGFGQRAEYSLQEARTLLDYALASPPGEKVKLPRSAESEAVIEGAVVACAQLQNALESLLSCAERSVEARLPTAPGAERDADRGAQQALIEELHTLVYDGIQVTRKSVAEGLPPDLEGARAREIHINRLEARARSEPGCRAMPLNEQLQLRRLVDAYEVAGNHVYRLLESLSQSEPLLAA